MCQQQSHYSIIYFFLILLILLRMMSGDRGDKKCEYIIPQCGKNMNIGYRKLSAGRWYLPDC